MYTQRFEW
jgi:hypothetical protein